MKIQILIGCLLGLGWSVSAQSLSDANKNEIYQIEQAIKPFANEMVMGKETIDRYKADSFFTRGLVKALKVPYSFYYNFDSIKTMSKIYAPDSSFKIFTWQLAKDFISVRQKGAIQMQTKDGSLKLFPLFDNSDDTDNPIDSVRSRERWIGALYYKIILKEYKGKKYYTLLGFDENDARSNKKWIEVLHFDEAGNPQFGGRFFQYANDEIKPKQPAYRFCMEYKKEAKVRINYDEDLDMIIFDHLMSEEKDPTQKFTLVPDGDYEAFKWGDGRWVQIAKPYTYKQDMLGVDPMLGNAPMPLQLRDDSGNNNEKMLDEISKRNGMPTEEPSAEEKNKPNKKEKTKEKKKKKEKS